MASNDLKLTIEQYESLTPSCSVGHGGHTAVFITPSRRTKWRVKTLFTKELDTIAWIEGFNTEDVLVDIGANVGTYTIWAAISRGLRVYAFEPEAQNYALLCRNIVINELSDKAIAYCIALSDETSFAKLYLSRMAAGESVHSFGASVDDSLVPVDKPITQGCFSTTLDKLVEDGVIPVPTHIKLDVDGFEHKVIAGAVKTIENKAVKSVLVELNSNIGEHRALAKWFVDKGFSYSEEQVRAATRHVGAPVANHIFRR